MSLQVEQNSKNVFLDFTKEKIELIKNTVCKGTTDDELQLFLHACKRTGLDPFMKQIYAIKRRNKDASGKWIETMTIQTGIDGFRLIGERTGKYAPGREPSYSYDSNGKVVSATAYIKKMTPDGTWHEVSATAFWSEYVQTYGDNKVPVKFWAQMPHNQLAKCAEALALRKAFPADMSGIYTTDEMAQAENSMMDADIEVSDFSKKSVFNESNTKKIEQKKETALSTVEVESLVKALDCDEIRIKKMLSLYKAPSILQMSRPQYQEAMKIATFKK